MQTLRHSVYLIVAFGSIALAACQPPDRFTEAPGTDIAHIADASANLLASGWSSIQGSSGAGSLPQRSVTKAQ